MLSVLLVVLVLAVVAVPFVLGMLGKSALVPYPVLSFLAKQGESFKTLVVSTFDKAKAFVTGLFKPKA